MLGYKYRVYPSNKQISRLNKQMELSKKLYNILLERAKEHYKKTGKTLTQFDMNKYITQMKKERTEFAEIHSQVLQNISKRIGDAYKNFFRRVKEKKNGKKIEVGFPRFKKFVCSLTYPQSGFKFKIEKKLHLSGIGNIPIILHRQIKGKIKTCTIKRYKSGKWFVCFSLEEKEKKFVSNDKEKMGIDLGLNSFVTFSNGNKIEPPKFLRKSEEKIKISQRRVSRKKKGSKNRRKAVLKLARVHEKIDNQRTDWLHKLSRFCVSNYSLIGVENLNIEGMMKNHNLSKSISDASWNRFVQMLYYKAGSAGCKVVGVDAKDTTKICSRCGNKRDIGLSERTYKCSICGHIEDRDVNSAKNILSRATVGQTGRNACRDLSSTGSVKGQQDISLKQELHETKNCICNSA